MSLTHSNTNLATVSFYPRLQVSIGGVESSCHQMRSRLQLSKTMPSNKSPEPTPIGRRSSACAVHIFSWAWFSFHRWAAERASENPKSRRGDMSIANDVHKNISQACRGGTRLRWAIHAAPMGLGTIIGLDGCYKHGAPTELGLARLPWSGHSPYPRRPNQTLDRMTRSAVSRTLQFERPWRAPHHRSAWRSASWTLGGKRITPDEIDPQMHADDRRFIRDIRVIRG